MFKLASFSGALAASSLLPLIAPAAMPGDCTASKAAASSQCPVGGVPVTLGALGQADIVDTAIEAGSFETLVAALQAADLVDALRGDGPFTVFAPTDAAFARLPEGTVERLLEPGNREALKAALTYHVVGAELPAADVVRLGSAATLNGQLVSFSTRGGSAMINGATISATDIRCRNGVIHVIDSVILPTDQTIVDVAQSAGQFSTLLAAAKAAGLDSVLAGKGPFTVLAPTDEAFAKVPAATVQSLLQPANREMLAAVLKYHVIPGRLTAAEAISRRSAETAEGNPVLFDIRDGRLVVDNATISTTDINASNGVVHVIDTVLMPPSS